MSAVFTKQAVIDLANDNAGRTYISIHENVYDVTNFLNEVYDSKDQNSSTNKHDLISRYKKNKMEKIK